MNNTKSSIKSSINSTEKRIEKDSIKVLISALLKYKTVQEAAAVAGITPQTLRDLMNDPEFRKAYFAAKKEAERKNRRAIIETPEKWMY